MEAKKMSCPTCGDPMREGHKTIDGTRRDGSVYRVTIPAMICRCGDGTFRTRDLIAARDGATPA